MASSDINVRPVGAVFRGQEEKYSSAFKLEAVKMYLHSMSIRAIAQVKQVHHSVIAYWIKKSGEIAKEDFYAEVAKVTDTKIQILELDELFTYIKKTCKAYVFLTVQREKLRIIDLYVSTSRDYKACKF